MNTHVDLELFSALNDYKELVKIIGNILDAPGKGGNISVKTSNDILIKSSGQDMKKDHVVTYNDVSIKTNDFSGHAYIKPSMELDFHKHIHTKYVVHYHPVYLLPFLCSDYEFQIDYNFKVIPYATPGKDLFNEISLSSFNKDCGILLLRNHGVILYSDDLDDIYAMHKYLRTKFKKDFPKCYTPDDVVDFMSDELWLFGMAIENLSIINNLTLKEISEEEKIKLLNDDNEKYRMKGIK